MKKRVLAMLLLVSLAFAGCGSNGKPNEELDKSTDEIVVGPDGSILDSMTAPTEVPTTAPATDATDAPDESGNVAENTSGESSANDDTASEEEKYYLTFEANTIEGEAWNSDQIANSKMTMINVWATYCNPCLAEMPDLGEIAAEYTSADFQIIGVVSDVMEGDSADNVDYAKELIAETQANYQHLLLNESLYMSFVGAVSAVPTTFFVRQDGSLIGYLTGAQSKEAWKSLIDQLLAEE